MGRRRRRALTGAGALALALAAGATLGVGGCGDDPFCGDGHTDEGEQCDDGNGDETDFCRMCEAWLPPQTIIKWEMNKDESVGFAGDGCIDLGVSTVDVEIDGAMAGSMSDGCTSRQVVFSDLPVGSYVARVTPRDASGTSLISAAIESTFIVNPPTESGERIEHEVIVPLDAWINDYTGTFRFRVAWGGGDCDEGVPPVTTQVLTLAPEGGEPFTALTDTGIPLDGTAPGDCVSLDEVLAQSAPDLPMGRASFHVIGRDADGVPRYDEEFETIIGAGASNPDLTFDVDPIPIDAGPDAAIDAPLDAPLDGPVDAGVPDA